MRVVIMVNSRASTPDGSCREYFDAEKIVVTENARGGLTVICDGEKIGEFAEWEYWRYL